MTVQDGTNECGCGCGKRVAGRFARGHNSPLTAPGDRFGRLVVVDPSAGRIGRGQRLVACRCDCGVEVVVRQNKLRTGRTQSCGCISATHRLSDTPTYSSWANMRARCTQPNRTDWPRYGGRGITVCDRWLEPDGQGFANFLADMGDRPAWATGGLDRIDNSGHYEPGNCRWATASQQQRNKRRAA